MGAVLSGAVVGGVVAGNYSTATVEKQIAAEQAKSAREFTRNQRQAAYVQLLIAHHEVIKTEGELVDRLEAQVGTTAQADYTKYIEQFEKAIGEFEKAFSTLVFVGTIEMGDLGDRMGWAHRSFRDRIHYLFDEPSINPEAAHRTAYLMRREFEDIVDIERKFIWRGRYDLGVDLTLMLEEEEIDPGIPVTSAPPTR